MADVFVSYCSADRERVRPIVERLRNLGLAVWWDQHIELGDDFGEAINRELNSASVVIVVWTANSVQSRFTAAEAYRGRERGKLVQIRADDVSLPVPFNTHQYVELDQLLDAPFGDHWKRLEAQLTKSAQSPDAAVSISSQLQTLGPPIAWAQRDTPFAAAREHARGIIEWAFHHAEYSSLWRKEGFGLSQFQKACEVRCIDFVELGFSGVSQFARFVCAETPHRVFVRPDGQAYIQKFYETKDAPETALELHSAEFYTIILYRKPKRIHPLEQSAFVEILKGLRSMIGPWHGQMLFAELGKRTPSNVNRGEISKVIYTLGNCNLIEFRPHERGPANGEYMIRDSFDCKAVSDELAKIAQAKVIACLGAVAPITLGQVVPRFHQVTA